MNAPLKKASAARSISVELINPFLIATANVLKLQAATEAVSGKAFRKEHGDKLFGDISGVIGIFTDSFSGSVVISFPEKTFLTVMSRMLGEEFKVMTPDIQDGASELTNIIFGSAKVVLNQKGFKIQTALPSVIVGSGHTILTTNRGPRVAIPFTSDAGEFFVEICLSA